MEGSDPTHVAASMHNQQPVQPPELVGHYMVCGFPLRLLLYMKLKYDSSSSTAALNVYMMINVIYVYRLVSLIHTRIHIMRE